MEFNTIEPNPLLLVTEFNNARIGFKIGEAKQIHRVSWEKFYPYSAQNELTGSNCVVGTVVIDSKIVLILDFEVILSEINPSASIESQMNNITSNKGGKDLKIVFCEDSKLIRTLVLKSLTT